MLLARILGRRQYKRLAIPLLRAYIRYAPLAAGKRFLWTRVVDPYFAWSSHEFVAKTIFGGRIEGNTQELLQQYVYYFGMWEPNLTRWIAERLKPGDTFVDVGANIGYFSLLASRLVGPSGRVVAIEASPGTFRLLQGNLARNDARNVRAVNMAAAASEGIAKVFRGPQHHIGLSSIVEDEQSRYGREYEAEVETAPLSVILQPDEIAHARVIKIDVEGAEWSVVSGMRPLLTDGRDDLEIMVELDRRESTERVAKLLVDAGFHPYSLENDYSAAGYLPPYIEKKPVRTLGSLKFLTDAVFSRTDAASL